MRLFLIVPALVAVNLLLKSQGVVPSPDGGYPGGNTAEGQAALLSRTTGGFNTAVGFLSLRSNTTNSFNTAVGAGTLLANTGDQNTATGAGALLSNTTGVKNTANGAFALFSNTTGNFNAANGASALFSNTTGNLNTANGDNALYHNTTGVENTAAGVEALLLNTTGVDNTANGYLALFSNTTGNLNTANGVAALENNNTGNYNVANGVQALQSNTTGSSNIALGTNAGLNLTTGSNNIDIGNNGIAGDANTIRIGNPNQTTTFIAGISGATASGGVAVFVNASGQLGTLTSSRRFKANIKPMEQASEAILALKPVTFRYKQEIDPKGIPQFGLVAEDVEKVNPNLVVRDAKGEVYTVRYEAVNAMLLNEFIKEHQTVQEQGATIARQQKQIEALTSGLEKVNARLEASKPTTLVVLKDR